MYEGNRVGVVVPAYNEEGQVGEVIRGVPGFVDRVYVVDDASTDGTWAEIRRAAEAAEERAEVAGNGQTVSTRVRTHRHERNRGVGGAIKTGYLAALEDDVDVVAVMAGDGQMDPGLLASFLDPIVEGRADYTKGNRLMYPETRRNVPGFRLFGNVLLTALTKVASGYWGIGDSQNGYAAISRRALEAVDVEEMYEFYGYCNDLLVRLNAAGMVVADVPAPIIYDDETSTIDYRTYVPRVSRMLLGDFLWRLKEKYLVRNFHPLVVLYAAGALGGATTLLGALRGLRSGESRRSSIALTGLVSVLLTTLAMLQDKAENESLGRRESRPDPDAATEAGSDPGEPLAGRR
jgi:glycosyltransferase involved in cell wall biosynthesis